MHRRRSIDCHRLLKIVLKGDIGLLITAIQFLELQVNILRERVASPIRVTPNERRKLLAAKKVLGEHACDFMLLVTSKTFTGWDKKPKAEKSVRTKKGTRGRPLTPKAIEQLVVRMARENQHNCWSKTRIYGELRKMGLGKKISRTTVGNIMRAHGFDPESNRGPGTWYAFIESHKETMWACDLFTKQIWSPRGFQDHYVLFFKHIGTRRVYISGITTHPNRHWMAQQARNFLMHLEDLNMTLAYLIRDNDKKFMGGFDVVFGKDIDVVRSAIEVPEMNGYAESFVKTIKTECLNHFTAMSESHLRYLLHEYVDSHYNVARPHRGLDNRSIGLPEPDEHGADFREQDVICDHRLGGIIKEYRWKQAA